MGQFPFGRDSELKLRSSSVSAPSACSCQKSRKFTPLQSATDRRRSISESANGIETEGISADMLPANTLLL